MANAGPPKKKYLFLDFPNIKISCIKCALKTFPLSDGNISINGNPNDNKFSTATAQLLSFGN